MSLPMVDASDPKNIKNKIVDFRERAAQAKMKAAATSERGAKRMFEDAAQQYEEMANKLEQTGRIY
ncbi:MAG TPA: hypothetical protein VN004_18960 [Pseudorhodoplanes sp.]|nr:hypothetical protein [Pseudorhodoplanes sp.]